MVDLGLAYNVILGDNLMLHHACKLDYGRLRIKLHRIPKIAWHLLFTVAGFKISI